MKYCIIVLLVFVFFSSAGQARKKKLVWADEFSGHGLPDSSKWSYDVGSGGWGNNELEYYTDRRAENARVESGYLIIEARKENYDSAQSVSYEP